MGEAVGNRFLLPLLIEGEGVGLGLGAEWTKGVSRSRDRLADRSGRGWELYGRIGLWEGNVS